MGVSRRRFIVPGVMLLTWLAYSSALHFDFVLWDDDKDILLNPLIQSLDWLHIKEMFNPSNPLLIARYMPLTHLGWAIQVHFFGLSPLAFHIGNILLHALNAGLVCTLINSILLARSSTNVTAPKPLTLISVVIAALFWSLNPLRVEAVAWATDRCHLQAACMGLLSAQCYLNAAKRLGLKPLYTSPHYWLSIIGLILSLLSYPSAISFGFVPLILDYYPLGRLPPRLIHWFERGSMRIWLEKLPFFLLAGASIFVALLIRSHATTWYHAPSMDAFGIPQRFAQACYITFYFLYKPWLPVHLSPVYTSLLSVNPLEPRFITSASIIIVLTWLAFRRCRSHPGATAFWMAYLAFLIPFMGFFEHPLYPSDRYAYLPSLCWSLWIAHRLSASPGLEVARKWTTSLSLTVLVIIHSILTLSQIQIWRNSFTLFDHMLEELGDHPYRSDIYWRLGKAHMLYGNTRTAIDYFDKTLNINPHLAMARRLREACILDARAH